MADANKDIVVTSINTYPLKSAKVAKVQEALVTNHGLEGDRTFMLIDGTKDRFLTQRKIPDMVKVSATYVDIAGRKGLKLSAPGAADLQFVPRLDGKTLDVAVWNHTVPAIDQGDEVAEWFSKLLGPAANYTRLVHVDAASSKVPVRHLPTNLQEALSSVYLLSHDDAPITLASQESLDELNGRLQERIGSSVPMNRFRMNIEVSGCTKPFDEDEWLAFRIGDVPFLGYYDKEVSQYSEILTLQCS